MRFIAVAGININAVRFDAVVRHLRHGVLRGEKALLHYGFIIRAVIHAGFAFVIVFILIPSLDAVKGRDGGFAVIGAAFRGHFIARAGPFHFAGNDVLLGVAVAVDMLRLVAVLHVGDVHAAPHVHIAGHAAVGHGVGGNHHRIIRGNGGVWAFFFLSILPVSILRRASRFGRRFSAFRLCCRIVRFPGCRQFFVLRDAVGGLPGYR